MFRPVRAIQKKEGDPLFTFPLIMSPLIPSYQIRPSPRMIAISLSSSSGVGTGCGNVAFA